MLEEVYKIHSLSPVENIEVANSIYEVSLNQAYSDISIKNIAITGIYGAGKSSIWKSFQKMKEESGDNDWKKGKIIDINLANFTSTKSQPPKKTTNFVNDSNGTVSSRIIKQIINQVLYQIDKKKIPLSKYSIKYPKTWILRVLQKLMIFSLFIGISLLLFRDVFSEVLKRVVDIKGLSILSPYSEFIVVIASLMMIAFPLIPVLMWVVSRGNFELTKLSLRYFGSEAKIKDLDEGVLDKEIKELVYLITASDVHTLVFEDLDRFDTVDVFSRLRELNFLVNARCKETVRFIYMIRDDLFLNKERTKFFDLIIPIIPVINSHNSRGKILELFSDIKDSAKQVDKQVLERISLYIDDMRVLKNIRNEYEVYYQQIESHDRELVSTKLFSMIAFKNIFPQEFDRLQQDRGFVYNVLKTKDNEIEERVFKLNHRIEEKVSQIESLKWKVGKHKCHVMAHHFPTNMWFINTNNRPLIDVLIEWSESPEKSYNIYYSPSSSKFYNFNELEQKISENQDYLNEIAELDKGDVDYRIKNLQKEVKRLREEIEKVHLLSISDLLQDKTASELEEFYSSNDVSNSLINDHYFPLIKYLLNDGLLDETYWHYKGYFHSGSLGLNDEIFLRSLFEGSTQVPTFELDNPKQVMSELKDADFERNGVVNYDLLGAVVENKRSEALWRIIKVALNEYENAGRISIFEGKSFIEVGKIVSLLLPDHLELLWQMIVIKMHGDLEELVLLSVIYSHYKIFPKDFPVDMDEYISAKAVILELEEVRNNTKFFEGLKSRECEFINLDEIDLSKDVAVELLRRDLFKPTFNNCKKIINVVTGKTEHENLKEYLSTIINTDDFSGIKDRLDEVLEQFIEDYIGVANVYSVKLNNDESAVLYVLNSEINMEIKEQFLDWNDCLITDLESIYDQELWASIIERKKLKYSNKNLNAYLNSETTTLETTIEYLNNNYSSEEKVELPVDLANILQNNESICETGFHDAIVTATEQISEINKELNDERVNWLIQHGSLEPNKWNIEHLLTERYEGFVFGLALKYGDKVADVLLTMLDKLPSTLFYLLIDKRVFSEDKTIQFINSSNKTLSLFEIRNADKQVKEHVLGRFFDQKDIERILDKPSEFDLLAEFALMLNQQDILGEVTANQLSDEFVDYAMQNKEVLLSTKVDLLAEAIHQNLKISNIVKWIKETPELKVIAPVFEYRQPKYDFDEYQERIVNALEEVGLISIGKRSKRLHLQCTVYREWQAKE